MKNIIEAVAKEIVEKGKTSPYFHYFRKLTLTGSFIDQLKTLANSGNGKNMFSYPNATIQAALDVASGGAEVGQIASWPDLDVIARLQKMGFVGKLACKQSLDSDMIFDIWECTPEGVIQYEENWV